MGRTGRTRRPRRVGCRNKVPSPVPPGGGDTGNHFLSRPSWFGVGDDLSIFCLFSRGRRPSCVYLWYLGIRTVEDVLVMTFIFLFYLLTCRRRCLYDGPRSISACSFYLFTFLFTFFLFFLHNTTSPIEPLTY